jgi:fructoselysine-6-P-deglycase FrlB-like protein
MNAFYTDIVQQPNTLRTLIDYYCQGEGQTILSSTPLARTPILTGMGSSFHAAWVATLHLHQQGIRAMLIESTDLLNYGAPMLLPDSRLVFVSQSGSSGEVEPIVNALDDQAQLIAVTNNSESPLAQHAQTVLPLMVETETLVACKTYLNSLAALWILIRQWVGILSEKDAASLAIVADEIENLLSKADSISARWLDVLASANTLLFLGHGPHAATARQAAMTVAEWAKQPVYHASVGAFRHGFVEITQSGFGVIIFAAPGPTHASAMDLANELSHYGAQVLIVVNGITKSMAETSPSPTVPDEFLSPILDIIPAQLFADALRQHRGISPEFRYIGKVVTQI